ncbi:potassium channel protein [Halorubrum sp. Ib24]|uniref:NAD-binding protein n=1 Tax=unclassified Halorubrum TaxID=2642239 RepID=UPI000B9880A0|nr:MULTISPECIES: NAD-binding protein [unclassified Halorubrum]OYR42974.1 potassium channel protein [Halorubrum sp. Ib24]OYR55079.1 potassium channel protein [Halorubrum sp. Ea1]
MSDSSGGPVQRAIEEIFYPADRIPLVEWREFSGARSTVSLTAALTLLSFVTGLSNLSQPSVTLAGPLAGLLPTSLAVPLARFGGVLFAFVLGILAVGLQRRKRIAWLAAAVVVPALAVLPLTTLRPTDIPVLVLIAITFPLHVRNRDQFRQSLDLSSLQIASLSAILGVVLYGTVGSYGLRDQFGGISTWGDAFYYVIVTIATVGYGDITPTTGISKWFSLSIILFGTGAFTVAVGALIGPAIESRMAAAFGNMTASELTLLEDHVVVLGYGDVTESLLEELGAETELVVVTPDQETASQLNTEGVNVLTDDPTDESVLRDARTDAARGVVVGSDDDARDVLAVLATRNVDPDVRIVAAANEARNVEKLESVGADDVINPLEIGGRLLGRSVLGGDSRSPLSEISGNADDE